jgi:hypothetical protein
MLLGTACTAVAIDLENTRKSLIGLKGIWVAVEGFEPEVERQGLSGTAVQTDAELRLRKAGIVVLTKEQFANDTGSSMLHLAAAISTDRASWDVSQFVELHQRVYLVRAPSVRLVANTWSVERVNVGAPPSLIARFVRDGFNDLVDQFINAYLAMNPKK